MFFCILLTEYGQIYEFLTVIKRRKIWCVEHKSMFVESLKNLEYAFGKPSSVENLS
jgi:hypothetical protein